MDKKLTAIQTLIQDMEALKKTKLYENSFKAINDCIDLAYAQLDKERLNIIEAHEAGQIDSCDQSFEDEAIDYFKETYKN